MGVGYTLQPWKSKIIVYSYSYSARMSLDIRANTSTQATTQFHVGDHRVRPCHYCPVITIYIMAHHRHMRSLFW